MVFVLISVVLCIPCSYFFIRVISAICVQNKIFELFVIFDVFGIQIICAICVRFSPLTLDLSPLKDLHFHSRQLPAIFS